MLLTTTDQVEGRRITRYLGIAAGNAILGANIFKDFFAGIRDVVGGRAGSYEKELEKARQIAIEEMTAQAQSMGANAVVGVDLDFETFSPGQTGGMMMVSANGTAVVIE